MTRNRHRCAWVEERVDSYLDGELSAGEFTLMEDHLGTCAHCRRDVARARSILEELRGLPEVGCPGVVVETVLRRAASERTPATAGFGAWPRGVRLRPLFAGALAVIVMVSALVAVRLNRTVEQFSPEQIEQAERTLRWTFAYLNEVSRRSGYAVRDEVFAAGVVEPVERAVRSALRDTQTQEQEEEKDGGSI